MSIRIALYARVSSERQTQAKTIDSQLAAICSRISDDGHTLLKEYKFVDDGFSGSTLLRPALERLRDTAANGMLDKIYVYSPDRLARKYAYQYLLVEEFSKLSIEIIFLNNPIENDPESNLLLQVQGIIAEYERTKIMERCRRGKIHAAKDGAPNVLSGAPYGYRYINKNVDGQARYEINTVEAEVIRMIFAWIAYERISINAVARRLTKMEIKTPTGKNMRWNRGSLCHILKNPAYKGLAGFGKTKAVPKKRRLRPNRGNKALSKSPYSSELMPKNEWILIPVPAIIDEDLFEAVQEQLEENKKRKRERLQGVCFLLRGLIICAKCQYAYVGSSNKQCSYYVCGGTRLYTNRDRVCNDTKSIRTEMLDKLVWNEVVKLLENPFYIEKEYNRRKTELNKLASRKEQDELKCKKLKLENSIGRLIDCYAEGTIEKDEFAPRIKQLKIAISSIDQQLSQFIDKQEIDAEIITIIQNIKEFAAKIHNSLKEVAWQTKRDIITSLVKRIEVGAEEINIVFRVDPVPVTTDRNELMEDCRRSQHP